MDSAVAGLTCQSAYNPQSSGIGGGFFMTIYLAERREAIVLNAREQAPSYASENMYGDNRLGSLRGKIVIRKKLYIEHL